MCCFQKDYKELFFPILKGRLCPILYVAIPFTEVRTWPVKRKIWSIKKGMKQRLLDGCATLRLRIGFVQKNLDQKAIRKLKNMRECYHGRRLQWSGYLERIKEKAWSNKFRTFNPPEFS